MERARLVLKPGKERSLLRRHLWLFSGAVESVDGLPLDGDVVDVVDSQGRFLACGHYQRTGSIRCRVLGFRREDEPEKPGFWKERLSEAVGLRKALGLVDGEETNACRLVHGEGDRLPGLVADWYAGVAVVQFHSLGMFRQQKTIAVALAEALKEAGAAPRAVYTMTEQGIHLRGDEGVREGFLLGKSGPVEILENGLKFRVDFAQGQKTGFFLDQRDNRALLGRYCENRSVCNTFAYTGGFSVYALDGGARSVDSVEISATAAAAIEENVRLNFGDAAPHRVFCQDAFDFFQAAPTRYETIVLDPPAFAKHRESVENALKGYRRINRAALRNIAPGGFLFTFSCSQLVSPELFREAVFSAAAQAGRDVRVLHVLHQGADHPVNLFHPESEYLKGLVLEVR